MNSAMRLFDPISIGRLHLNNRFVLAPMATHYGTDRGRMTERQIEYYVERARGGVGLIISESNYVSLNGRGGINRLGLYDDSQISEHRQLTDALHAIGTPICAQLHHGGSTVSMDAIGQYPVSCSTVPMLARGEHFVGNIPRTLSATEIEDLVGNFASAAWRAMEAGFDAVMVHGAHGYLINEFLSPHTNKRNDAYGGSDKNRARFLTEIVRAVREKLGPDFPLMVRLTGQELFDGGYDLAFIQKVAVWLENEGVDEINTSAGNYEEMERMVAPDSVPEGFLSGESALVKQVVKIPVGVVGRIMSPETAEEILARGEADLIYLGRALIADPEFPRKIQENRADEIRPCIACNKGCIDRLFLGLDLTCSVNAAMGQEVAKRIVPVKAGKRVVVVGAGPAGLEAARVAAVRGHDVTVFERTTELGGALQHAALMTHKEPIRRLIGYYTRMMEVSGVKIEFGKEVTPGRVAELNPDVLILAVGANPCCPKILGANLLHVFMVEDCLQKQPQLGQSVVIVGGGLLGAETAKQFVGEGKNVTIVEQLDSVAVEAGFIVKKELLKTLGNNGVKMLTRTRALAITNEGVVVERFNDKELLACDSVVLAIGYEPRRDLSMEVDMGAIEFYEIGDCVKPRTVMEAIEEGSRVGFSI